MEGYGFLFEQSHCYFGEFKDDNEHGYGITIWKDRMVYEGYWKNGLQHGLGTLSTPKRVKKGMWKLGHMSEIHNNADVYRPIDFENKLLDIIE